MQRWIATNMNNIDKLIFFLKDNKKDLLIINQVNEEVCSFYLTVIIYMANELNIKLIIGNDTSNIDIAGDLFEEKKLNIINTQSKKIIDQLLEHESKMILFTDYKNYKIFQGKCNAINGYNYTADIKYYLKEKLKISNEDLINYIINNPQFTYSEISKYQINSTNYLDDLTIKQKTNFILEIRKSIFQLKKNNDLKETFFKIKEESFYKKFNFLTY